MKTFNQFKSRVEASRGISDKQKSECLSGLCDFYDEFMIFTDDDLARVPLNPLMNGTIWNEGPKPENGTLENTVQEITEKFAEVTNQNFKKKD